MTTSIFIKGCREQLDYLYYCLRALKKNLAEWDHSDIVVKLDPDCEPHVANWDFDHVLYRYETPWDDRYMHALWSKATADQHLGGDLILLVDCDTFLSAPVALADYVKNGSVALQYLPWDIERDAGQKVALELWPRVVKASTGLDLPVDYMVTRPWLFWRSTFTGARGLVEAHQKKSFYAACFSQAYYDWTRYPMHPFTFCDLETLGLYGALYEPHKYYVSDFRSHIWPEPWLDLWSHTPFNSLKAKLDSLLVQSEETLSQL